MKSYTLAEYRKSPLKSESSKCSKPNESRGIKGKNAQLQQEDSLAPYRGLRRLV
ncbi:hypothetical protein TNIN_210361, partial [Trichonephila inaurata madagascariensis]